MKVIYCDLCKIEIDIEDVHYICGGYRDRIINKDVCGKCYNKFDDYVGNLNGEKQNE